MVINFKKDLYKKIKISQLNSFSKDNFDEYRFGDFEENSHSYERHKISKKKRIKKFIKRTISYNKDFDPELVDNFVDPYSQKIEKVCRNISKKDRSLYLDLIAYRILGYTKVKLPRNNRKYWNALKKVKSVVTSDETYDPQFLHFILKKIDLKSLGYNIKLFFTEKGVAIDFLIEQYKYKKGEKSHVLAEVGDHVLDLGGCWGDTALYFAHKVRSPGKVYSFEFVPGNVKIFKKNINLNPSLKSHIQLIEIPVSDISGENIYYKDLGPGSHISLQPFEGFTGQVETISIDDFVTLNKIQKVDFIKMDIEGAELKALEGARETIKKFRPKLAIAIYHSFEDFVTIPNWILDLETDYDIFIDHFSIHAEETICFAKPKETKII